MMDGIGGDQKCRCSIVDDYHACIYRANQVQKTRGTQCPFVRIERLERKVKGLECEIIARDNKWCYCDKCGIRNETVKDRGCTDLCDECNNIGLDEHIRSIELERVGRRYLK